MRILLIEDESALGAVIRQGLEAARYSVEWARDGNEGMRLAQRAEHDLIVLDLMLPGKDGWSICEDLRSRKVRTPILMLTAKGEVGDRVRGLEMGADDYLTKPFAFPELRARVQALLRRDRTNKARVVRIADLEIDTHTRRVERGGREIALTPREYSLLEALALAEGETVSREVIQERVWAASDRYSNTVEVYIHSLRRKVDQPGQPKLIQTVHRYGYTLRPPDTD
jgi:two-component system copper resistance phosphate regulon response regulator CusR